MREQDLLLARDEADALRQQHGSRAEGTRHLLEAKQQEVLQLQAELERREADCGQLKQVLAEGQPQGTGREAGAAAAAVGAIEVRGGHPARWICLEAEVDPGKQACLYLAVELASED